MPVAITSIAPGNDALRGAISLAVDSWRANGFAPLSINFDDEVSALARVYPAMPVKRCSRAEGVFENRYGPSLGALFDNFEADRLVCIINSDIYMMNSNISHIIEGDPQCFIASRRLDISYFGGENLGEYSRGVDAVIFNPSVFSAVLQDERVRSLQLGAPFWDIVLPTIASFHGPVRFVKPPFLLHAIHPASWNAKDYEIIRKVGIKAVLMHARRHAAASLNARKFLYIVERTAGPLERLERPRQYRAIARVVNAWLLKLEATDPLDPGADMNDPVFRRLAPNADGEGSVRSETGRKRMNALRRFVLPPALRFRSWKGRKRQREMESAFHDADKVVT